MLQLEPKKTCIIALVLATCVFSSACSRLTFIRPPTPKPPKELKQENPVSGKSRSTNDPRELLMLATKYYTDGNYDVAEKHTRNALKKQPNSVDALTMLANIEAARGNNEQAGAYYAKVAELQPRDGVALNNYGAWLCANGRTQESLPYFGRALGDTNYRDRASSQANFGSCALTAGRMDLAESNLREAVEQAPEKSVALAGMAKYLYTKGEYFQARAFIERRLAAASASPEVLGLAADIEQKLGDQKAANQYRERIRSEFASPVQP